MEINNYFHNVGWWSAVHVIQIENICKRDDNLGFLSYFSWNFMEINNYFHNVGWWSAVHVIQIENICKRDDNWILFSWK